MSSWADRSAEEAEEEEDGVEADFRSADDHVLFLVDARPAMFSRSDCGEAFIVNCLRVAQSVMKSKIVASDRSTVGVILFGAESKPKSDVVTASASHPQVTTLFSLDVPSAERLKKLETLLRDSGGAGLLDELQMREAGAEAHLCPLREALWASAQAFHAVGSKVHSRGDSKRLWLFTNDDHPNEHDTGEQSRTVQVARDCAETGVEISLWHMPPQGGGDFSPSRFFVELLLSEKEFKQWREAREAGRPLDSFADSLGEDDVDEMMSLSERIQPSGAGGFNAKECRMRRKEHKKRRLGSLTLHLNGTGKPGAAIAMGMYKLLHPATRPQYTWLQAATNLPTKSTSILMDGTTAAVLDESQVSTYIDFNGLRVPMTVEDMKVIKSSQPAPLARADADAEAAAGTPFIRLLYCAPREALRADMQLKDSSFLFPDDSTIAGSMSLFRCLLRQLVDKGLVAVGHFQRTAGGEARLVVMYPCDEKTDGEGYMELPGGLHIIPLPFMQDIRNVVDPCAALPASTAVAAARDLVAAMQFGPSFRYTDLESPGVQHFYSVLQAVALNDEQGEWRAESDDMLQPDAESLRVHEGLIAAFGAVTGLADDVDDSAKPKASRKRAAPSAADGGPAQKVKVEDSVDIDKLDTYSAAELKEACRARGLPVSGAKAVLAQRLRDHA